MGAWRVIGDALIFLPAVCAVYLTIVMARRINSVVLKASYWKALRYELIGCAFFLLCGLEIRFGVFTKTGWAAGRAIGWTLRILALPAAAVVLFFLGKVAAGSFIRSPGKAKNAIVLGLALERGRPTRNLLFRLDEAERFSRENPEAKLILTGGNPDASGRTEAAVMRELLAERGVGEERMILEDQAETTKANFRNTARMIDPEEPLALITNGYHMDRAVHTAKSAGFTRVLRRPAPSSRHMYAANLVWEVIAELNDLTLKQ